MAGIPPIEPYALPTAGELPANTAQWTPDPDRAVLLVHDMQHFFLAPFPDSVREPLVSNAAALRDAAAGLGVPVAYTTQPGSMTEQERGLLADFWGPGMRRDPADRAVVDALAPQEGDWKLTKWRYSAFHNSPLLDRMRASGRDQLVICGVYAHVGVLTTAVEAFTHDIQPFLVADAVADFDESSHRMALDYAAGRCAMVLTAKEVFA
ncbi:isochorismatase family protein [Kitasatospora purpeofusca]|uniref:isochorismatase family protein n=1 Tax=Kitasatospora purpeofusca TaxID=67352 RepID=UPI0004C03923|nr:isochorismatase family protein [Kitasatospora purpeofusca]